MTVGDLINELRQYPSDMKVVKVTDFENTDEYGNCQTEDIENVMTQTFIDVQFGDSEETELMIY
jgi:hypothetical protein